MNEFLTVMRSSRSDIVIQSVHKFVMKESLNLKLDLLAVLSFLKSFYFVSRMLKGCLKFQGCFKEISRMFQVSLRVFTKRFKKV